MNATPASDFEMYQMVYKSFFLITQHIIIRYMITTEAEISLGYNF